MVADVGAVEAILRYPVKSMFGEALERAELGKRGVAGDRTHALIDVATGRVVSAKSPRPWRDTLRITARAIDGGRVELSWPGSAKIHCDDPELHAALSRRLGREVRLVDAPPEGATLERARPDEVLERGAGEETTIDVRPFAEAAPGTFFDFAPLHLVTSATLARIAEEAGEEVDAMRYRPNLVLRSPAGAEPFAENAWAGHVLRVGAEVALEVIVATPRCAVPMLAHGALPARPAALRVPVHLNRVEIRGLGERPCVGAYAKVIAGGCVARGDAVRLVPR